MLKIKKLWKMKFVRILSEEKIDYKFTSSVEISTIAHLYVCTVRLKYRSVKSVCGRVANISASHAAYDSRMPSKGWMIVLLSVARFDRTGYTSLVCTGGTCFWCLMEPMGTCASLRDESRVSLHFYVSCRTFNCHLYSI